MGNDGVFNDGWFFMVYNAGVMVLGGGLELALSVALSGAAGGGAVVLPQVLALWLWVVDGRAARRGFGVWATKFALVFLLMVVAVRGLAALELLAGAGFVFGVVVGVLVNVFLAARLDLQFVRYNRRRN